MRSLNRCEKVSTSSTGLGHPGSSFLKILSSTNHSFRSQGKNQWELFFNSVPKTHSESSSETWHGQQIDIEDTFVRLLTNNFNFQSPTMITLKTKFLAYWQTSKIRFSSRLQFLLVASTSPSYPGLCTLTMSYGSSLLFTPCQICLQVLLIHFSTCHSQALPFPLFWFSAGAEADAGPYC